MFDFFNDVTVSLFVISLFYRRNIGLVTYVAISSAPLKKVRQSFMSCFIAKREFRIHGVNVETNNAYRANYV